MSNGASEQASAVTVRLTGEELARLDRAREGAAIGRARVSRSALAREALVRGLDALAPPGERPHP